MLSAVPAHSGRGDHLGELVAAVRSAAMALNCPPGGSDWPS